jgi:glycosyltransferase involved in cell wall biosynthesis
MKRVCIDARLIQASGIGTFLKNMLQVLSQASTIQLTLLHWKKDREALTRYTPHLIALQSPIYSIREQLELQFKIPRCDLFWSPHFNIPLLPIRACKRLTTIHDVYHLAHLKQFPLLKRLYAQIIVNSACLYSDEVTTLSDFSRSEIVRLCKIIPKRLTRIHFGVGDHFMPSPLSAQIRAKYSLPGRYLLSLSNFKVHKNIRRLVAAYEDLKEEIVLVLAGSFSEKYECKKPIIYPGYIEEEDLSALYSSAEAFIFPSLYEGFGSPPLEAMACGCPVIASSSASLPEICGLAAEYVDPLNISSIRQGIERVLNDSKRREALIQKGFTRAGELKAKEGAEKHLRLIEALCE